MCGLVGIAGAINAQAEKGFSLMLELDSIRGKDSTGVAVVPRMGDVKVVKQVGHGMDFVEHPAYNRALAGMHRVIIGHNRYGTMGGISRRNAHPFDFDTLVGAHNGTLRSKHRLLDHTHFQVDSENLYYHMENEGIDDLMEKLEGAWALTWWDKIDNTLNLLRNKERPLCVSQDKERKLMMWASEPWMIRVASDKFNLGMQEIVSIEPDMLHTIPINEKGELDKCRVVEKKAKEPVFFSQAGAQYHGSSYGNCATSSGTSSNSSSNDGKFSGFPKSGDQATSAGGKVISAAELFQASKKLNVSALYEVIALDLDDRGNRYAELWSMQEPLDEVRCYYHAAEESLWQNRLGMEVSATINSFNTVDGLPIFKVLPQSIRVVGEVKQGKRHADLVDAVVVEAEDSPVPVLEIESDDIEETTPEIKDHRGNVVDRLAYKRLYPRCDGCYDHIEPGDGHKLSYSGNAFCPNCADDAEATHGILFMK